MRNDAAGGGSITPATYERWRQSALGRITEELEFEAVAAMLPDIRGAKLLDAGCGDGTYANRLAARGAIVTGLDLSSAMLVAARQRASTSHARVRWCQGDIAGLPFADRSLDIVLVMTVLCTIHSPEQAVRELARVLRPGGVLIIGELGRWSMWAASRKIRAWLGARSWQHAHFWSLQELRRLTAQAGLTRIATRSAIFYPPCGIAARLLKPWDLALSHLGRFGAAFLLIKAQKPEVP